MGLDFSHGEAYWSYSGFNTFRTRLAQEIGFNLDDMIGFGGIRSFDEINDDIKLLLDHSDCDGILTVEECERIVPRLKQIVATWDDNDWDKRRTLQLIEGMEDAILGGDEFEFM